MGAMENIGYSNINHGSADTYNFATDGNPAGLQTVRAGGIMFINDVHDIPMLGVDRFGRIVKVINR